MNYPFKSVLSKKVRHFLCCTLSLAMLTVSLTGCFTKKAPDATEDPTVNVPNLVESTDPSEPETEPATEPPTEPEIENVATVKEQTNVRPSPSTGANVSYQLDAGEQVQVFRVETLQKISWAYINALSSEARGWVNAESLDLSKVSDEILVNNTSTPAGSDPENPTASTEPTAPTTTPTVSGKGTKGVVLASELNIRSEAEQTAARVGGLRYGDRVNILETKNGWGRVDKGWISLTYVYIDGERGKNTATGTVTASQLTVREGPGTNYDRANTLNQGARVEILEQVKVGGKTWGCISGGWVCMDYVDIGNGTTGTGTTTPAAGTATVNAATLNVRSGAGTEFATLGGLVKGQVVTILEKTSADGFTWGRINFNGNAQAWIALEYCTLN